MKLVKKILPHTHLHDNLSNVYNSNFRTKCCICITPRLAAMYLVNAFEKNDKPTLKISRLKLYSEKMAFGFENASPYVDKIDRILQALIEAGVQSSWKYAQMFDKARYGKRRGEKRNADEDSPDRIVLQFAAMLLFFHAIAAAVFVVELLIKRIGPRVRGMFMAV